jgi:anti-sigma B factor antagonist
MRFSDVQQHTAARLDPGALDVTVVVSEKTAVVRAAGELDMATVPELATVLEGLERECVRIVLDVSDLAFIGSTGLRLALIEHDRATADGFEFVIAGANGRVLEVLRLTGLDVALPLAPDVASVLGDAGPPGAGGRNGAGPS